RQKKIYPSSSGRPYIFSKLARWDRCLRPPRRRGRSEASASRRESSKLITSRRHKHPTTEPGTRLICGRSRRPCHEAPPVRATRAVVERRELNLIAARNSNPSLVLAALTLWSVKPWAILDWPWRAIYIQNGSSDNQYHAAFITLV